MFAHIKSRNSESKLSTECSCLPAWLISVDSKGIRVGKGPGMMSQAWIFLSFTLSLCLVGEFMCFSSNQIFFLVSWWELKLLDNFYFFCAPTQSINRTIEMWLKCSFYIFNLKGFTKGVKERGNKSPIRWMFSILKLLSGSFFWRETDKKKWCFTLQKAQSLCDLCVGSFLIKLKAVKYWSCKDTLCSLR